MIAGKFFTHRTTADVQIFSRFIINIINRPSSAAIVGLAVSLLLLGYHDIRLDLPLNMSGDHFFVLTEVRNDLNNTGYRYNPYLGFPGIHDDLSFTGFDFSYKFILYIAALFSKNPFIVVHTFYLFSISAMFVAAYVVLKKLEIRSWLAAIAAIAFVVSPFFLQRAARHDFLALYYGIPLGVYLAIATGISTNETGLVEFFRQPMIIVSLLVVSTSGLYYAFFSAMFIGLVGVCGAAAEMRGRKLTLAALQVTIIFVLMILSGWGLGIVDVLAGNVHVPRRYPVEQSMYGLLIADAIRTFAVLPPLKWSLSEYTTSAGATMEGASGEWPGILLTSVILAAPVYAIVAGWTEHERSAGARVVFLAAACITFGLVFAQRYGLGYLFNTYVYPAIRGQNRIMPFLSFFALLIVCSAVEAALSLRLMWYRVAVSTVILLGLGASSLPFIGGLAARQKAYLSDPAQTFDRESMITLLGQLHAAGLKTVLQLPVLPWSEWPFQRGFLNYSHQMGYVLDASPGIRWSFGSAQQQTSYAFDNYLVRAHRDDGLAKAAADAGFDAILIEKAAYDDGELKSLTEGLAREVPAACKLQDDSRRVLFSLSHDTAQRPCLAHPRQDRPDPDRYQFSFAAGELGPALFMENWSQPDAAFTWSGSAASLLVPLPLSASATSRTVELTLDFVVFMPDPKRKKKVEILIDGRLIKKLALGRGGSVDTHQVPVVTYSAGAGQAFAKLLIRTSPADKPSDYGSGDTRTLGVALTAMTVRRLP